MKNTLATLLLLFPILLGASYGQIASDPTTIDKDSIVENSTSMKDTIVIKVGNSEFKASLSDNPTATEFKALLPLTIDMTELNGNEKYFRLSKNLPTKESNPGTINSGDLMMWGPNTLVLFYETSTTSYSYTMLGKINNANGLAAALGNGDVTVTIALTR
jgi:hypothetical protein